MEIKEKILVVDDDKKVLEMIETVLISNQRIEIVCETSGKEALKLIKSEDVDVVITDINMADMNGLQLLEEIGKVDENLPVILITGFADIQTMQRAIKLGAFDFLRKPFNIAELHIAVKQAIQKRKLIIENAKYTNHLEQLVKEKTKELTKAYKMLENNFIQTVLAMMNALEATDVYTKGHSERVTNISVLIAREMGLNDSQLKILQTGAVLHDLGKIGIYKSLLTKPTRLSEDELDIIKQHPTIGEKIIRPIDLHEEIRNIVIQHHERIDGSGYPYGLKKDEISPYAKIVAVADAYDAMTSGRVYRETMTHEQAYNEIMVCAGSQFDSDCVKAFYKIAKDYDLTTNNNIFIDIFSSK